MVWENLKGQNVKIVQRDEWVKTGIFLGVSEGFVQLRYTDGRVVSIAVDQIVILEPKEGRICHQR